MEFRILGPLEVSRDGEPVTVLGRHHPRLLALLLLETGRVVTINRLVDALWEDQPPATARRQVQNAMASLRRQLTGLGAPTIEVTGEGYRLIVSDEAVDAQQFADLVRQARGARDRDDLTAASRQFAAALGLWRGEALAGLSGRVVEAAVVRLNESRLAAVEDRCEVEIALGHHGQVVGELRELLEHHPYRQRVAGLLMTALHHGGRTPEALEVFTGLRARLSRELGLDPDPELSRLHGEILRGDLAAPGVTEVRSSAPRPAQLPADTATFTGRQEQLSALDELLDDGRTAAAVSAIAGMGGAGKTALAVHWGHHVRERFPDGQLYINLRGFHEATPVAPADALARFLNALGQTGSMIPDDVDEAGAMYRSLLADRRMLILLDNARDAAQVRPLLPGGAGNFALVTSRDRLTSLAALDDVAPIRLDTLNHGESVELLANLVGAKRLHAEPEAAHRLAQLCGHLPLALRIAAANLADRSGVGVMEFVAELEGPQRLERLAVADDPKVAVARTLALSFNALAEGSRRLFIALGVLPGEDFSEDLAAHLAETVDANGDQAIAALRAAHLVEGHHANRLRFHDLVRDYATDRAAQLLDDDERNAIQAAYINWHHQHPSQLAIEDYNGILEALEQWPQHEELWKLAIALSEFKNAGSNVTVALELLTDMAPRVRRSASTKDIVDYFISLSSFHRDAGDAEGNLRCMRTAIHIETASGEPPTGRARGNLAVNLIDLGRLAEAEQMLLDAIREAKSSGNTQYVVPSVSALAAVYRHLGKYRAAEQQLLSILDDTGDLPENIAQFTPYFELAQLDVMMSRYDVAMERLTNVVAIAQRHGYFRQEIRAYMHRGDLYRRLGDLESADADLTIARDLAHSTGRTVLSHNIDLRIARLLIARGDFSGAIDNIGRVDLGDSKDPDIAMRAEVAIILCSAYTGLRDVSNAIHHGEHAVAMAKTISHPRFHGEALAVLACALHDSGDTEPAETARRQAQEIFTNLGVPEAEELRRTLADG